MKWCALACLACTVTTALAQVRINNTPSPSPRGGCVCSARLGTGSFACANPDDQRGTVFDCTVPRAMCPANMGCTASARAAPPPPLSPCTGCDYCNDGECDEQRGHTGGHCPAGTDIDDCSADVQNNSCEYAKDGQCDEPQGSQYCASGTDTYDCHKDCAEFENEQGIEQDCEEFERDVQHCDGACSFTVMVFLLLCLSYPCIVFMVAYGTCIKQKKDQGRAPTQNAWAICASVMIFVVYSLALFSPMGTGLLFYCFGPCCMIIPFMMDDCYCDGRPRAAPNRVGQVAPSSNPVFAGQPMTVMAHPVCAPVAVMAQPLPMQMATAVAIPQPMQQPARQAIVTATVVQDDI